MTTLQALELDSDFQTSDDYARLTPAQVRKIQLDAFEMEAIMTLDDYKKYLARGRDV